MDKRVSFDADDITIVNDGTFENVIILGVKSGEGEKLSQQIIQDGTITTALIHYAQTDNLSICKLLIKYEQYKKDTQRVKLEYAKFTELRFDGLEENGKSQLDLLNFCLNGKLSHEMRYNFCMKNCGKRTDTEDGICRMCKGWNN